MNVEEKVKCSECGEKYNPWNNITEKVVGMNHKGEKVEAMKPTCPGCGSTEYRLVGGVEGV